MQKKYAEYQTIDQRVKQIKEQLEKFEIQIQELNNIHESLMELKQVKNNTELLVPMSSGIFVKAAVQNTDKLIVNVGANIGVEKTIDETANLLAVQQNEIVEYRQQLMEQMQLLVNHAGMLERELTALAESSETGE